MVGKFSALLRLARVQFLISGIILYILGTLLAVARGWEFDLMKFIIGYSILGLSHVSLHFNNDYYDKEGDTLEGRTPISGGSGALQDYPELAPLAFRIALLLSIISVLLGAAFTLYFTFPIWFLVFVIGCNLIAWFYSAPPVKLAYRGYGEVSTALAVGILMPGLGYFVTSGTIDAWFLILSVPLLCYGLFFILSVELPDVENDRRMAKVNLLVKRGREIGYKGAVIATSLATAVLLVMALTGSPGSVNMWPIVVFSLMPLGAATLAYLRNEDRMDGIVRQVKMNFASIFIFVVAFNIFLFLQMI